jgi:hypothetical protein
MFARPKSTTLAGFPGVVLARIGLLSCATRDAMRFGKMQSHARSQSEAIGAMK